MGPASDTHLSIRPASIDDDLEIWSMIQEIGPGENGFHNSGYGVPFSRFTSFLRRLVDASRGRGLPDGYVPETTFWVFAGDRPVGITKIRHHLTDALRQTGGHIGYTIRPTERQRGYGTRMLTCTLHEAARLGIHRALVTVHEENRASCRMVEANRGELVRCADGKRYYEVPTG